MTDLVLSNHTAGTAVEPSLNLIIEADDALAAHMTIASVWPKAVSEKDGFVFDPKLPRYRLVLVSGELADGLRTIANPACE